MHSGDYKIDDSLKYLNGDITQEELSDRQSDIAEFNSLSDRIIRVGEAWVNSQRKDGIDANITSLYMHKFIREIKIEYVVQFFTLIKRYFIVKIQNQALNV